MIPGGASAPPDPPLSRSGGFQIWICILDVISTIWICIYIYSGCYIQCQYSDRSIYNIGTQITKIHNTYPYSDYNSQNTYPYLEASRPT